MHSYVEHSYETRTKLVLYLRIDLWFHKQHVTKLYQSELFRKQVQQRVLGVVGSSIILSHIFQIVLQWTSLQIRCEFTKLSIELCVGLTGQLFGLAYYIC